MFFLLFFNILLSSCSWGIVDYQIKNSTVYEVTIIDESTVKKTEYKIPANSSIFIRHYNSARFSVKSPEGVIIRNLFDISIIYESY